LTSIIRSVGCDIASDEAIFIVSLSQTVAARPL